MAQAVRRLLAMAAVLGSSLTSASAELLWEDVQGRVISAEFVALDGTGLTIRKSGTLHTVPISRLSPASAKTARELAASSGPKTGDSVIAFCRSHLGRKVGDGQCASLATHALAAAQATRQGKDHPGPGDYVWGKLVAWIRAERAGVTGTASIASLRPGDVIQFRGARFQGRTPNGGTYWMTAYHHTAIVDSADLSAATITVLHQNWGRKVVRRDVLKMGDLRTGWLRIYRPVAAGH